MCLNLGRLTLCLPSPHLPHTGPWKAAADPQTSLTPEWGSLELAPPAPQLHRHTQTHLQACNRAGGFVIINNFLPPSLPQTCSTSLPTGSRAGLTFEPTIILSLVGEARGNVGTVS